MTTIFLVRHGRFENPAGVYPFRADGFPLSDHGNRQIEDLANKLLNQNITTIYSSPILRCHQTGEIISQKLGIPLNIDPRLIEVLSPFQGTNYETLDETVKNTGLYALPEQIKDGEMPEIIVARMKSVLNEVLAKYQDKKAILVSHGDPIMLMVYSLTGKDLYSLRNTDPDYIPKGGCYKLCFEGNKFLSVDKFN